MDWDTFFISLCYLIAMKSKDINTKIGSVIVDDLNNIVSVGYNSFPRGINDNVKERYVRPDKVLWFEHSERNAIYGAAMNGMPLKGKRLYTMGIPCIDCARAVVQSGIKEVIVHKTWNDGNANNWNQETSYQLFDEAGVKLREWDGNIISEITAKRHGLEFEL